MRLPILELRRILTDVEIDERRPIRVPMQSAEILGPLVRGLEVEVALALLLDSRHAPIGVVEVARGGLNVVHISPRDLFRTAIFTGCPAIILAHNHPSDDVIPSEGDVALTSRMRAAGELVGVEVLDHLILGSREVFSFTASRKFQWSSTGTEAAALPAVALVPAAEPVEQESGGDNAAAS